MPSRRSTHTDRPAPHQPTRGSCSRPQAYSDDALTAAVEARFNRFVTSGAETNSAPDPLLDAVRLTPMISARSNEIEDRGSLPPDLVDAIKPTGAFRQWVPTELDGPAVPAWTSLQVIEQFGYADGAVGWCVAIATTSSLLSAFLPAEWGKLVYADPGSVTGGFAMPKGRARPLPEGGLEVTGRWQWGSGTTHCTWIGGGCLLVDDSGAPAARPGDGLRAPFVFFDRDDVEIVPTWEVSGLAGTGSNDYTVDRAHVPEGRWVEIGSTEATYPNPLTHFSFYGLLALAVAATTVGIARRSIDELVDLAQSKRPQGSSRSLRERTSDPARCGVGGGPPASRLVADGIDGRSRLAAGDGRDGSIGRGAPPTEDGRHPRYADGSVSGRDDVQGRRGSSRLSIQPSPALSA